MNLNATNNLYLDCASLFLSQSKRDLEVTKKIYTDNYIEHYVFLLQQSNEKLHKAFVCILQYILQDIPLTIGKCLEEKLRKTNSPYYPLVVAIVNHLESLKMRDSGSLENYLKSRYSHNVVKGFYNEIEQFLIQFKYFKDVLISTIRTLLPPAVGLSSNIIELYRKTVYREKEDIEELIKDKNLDKNYLINSILLFTVVLESKDIEELKEKMIEMAVEYLEPVKDLLKEFFPEFPNPNEFAKYIASISVSFLKIYLQYKLMIFINLVLAKYAEVSRYPNLSKGKLPSEIIQQDMQNNLDILIKATDILSNFIDNVLNNMIKIHNDLISNDVLCKKKKTRLKFIYTNKRIRKTTEFNNYC
ncbi:hypothetical protein [Acidianus sp. HS-5]|uniref:hypothetical protein n=1 Tax=Acidianus sp. HS-5 TaxID=2886040 RepID=UPI001F35C942|nr:hypothetical protein [Acidianus sp. HS-5]BDC17421.1 hypothetical protein HS5_03110 [Acidianus sp. HS-5]